MMCTPSLFCVLFHFVVKLRVCKTCIYSFFWRFISPTFLALCINENDAPRQKQIMDITLKRFCTYSVENAYNNHLINLLVPKNVMGNFGAEKKWVKWAQIQLSFSRRCYPLVMYLAISFRIRLYQLAIKLRMDTKRFSEHLKKFQNWSIDPSKTVYVNVVQRISDIPHCRISSKNGTYFSKLA